MHVLVVVVQGDRIGHVLDNRNMDTCPNYNNLSKKPAEELRQLLIKVREGRTSEVIHTVDEEDSGHIFMKMPKVGHRLCMG